MNVNRALLAAAGLAFLLGQPSPARAVDISVLCSNGLRAVMQELIPQFERATKHTVTIRYGLSAALKREIDTGAPFDLAVLTPGLVDDLIKQGRVAAETRAVLARGGMALAIRAGAPRPDIRTPEALTRTLLASTSIAYAKEGAGGVFFVGLTRRLGLVDALQAKIKPTANGNEVIAAVAGGHAQLGVLPLSEILAVPGVEVLGTFPPDVQGYVEMVAGMNAGAKQSAAVKALIAFVMAPGSLPVLKQKGMERSWASPRLPDGQPDLQGVWLSSSATPLERPTALEGRASLTETEVAELQKRADKLFTSGDSDFAAGDNVFLAALAGGERFENPNATETSLLMVRREFESRTSLIVDPPEGRLPPLTPDGQRRATAALAAAKRPPAGPEDLSNPYRCITTGVPKVGGLYGAGHFGYYQILQTPEYVVIAMETIHDARIVPLDGRPHLHPSITQWNGDSRGRWEGETLVVETTNFSPKSNFLGSAEHLHLVERLTRVAPDAIRYEVTVDDPTTWTRPWTAALPWKLSADVLFEFACHEGNTPMAGMLAGARAQEQAAERAR
jgi:molybdenum ABC transporter molybdate-binding protein